MVVEEHSFLLGYKCELIFVFTNDHLSFCFQTCKSPWCFLPHCDGVWSDLQNTCMVCYILIANA